MKWRLVFAGLVLIVVVGVAARGLVTSWIGESLACGETIGKSDAILIENFDVNYLVFERAAALQKATLARHVLVPVETSPDPVVPNPVFEGVAEVMARQARLDSWAVIPIRHTEPIRLNAAIQLREHLVREGIGSLIVVSPGFSSRRSSLVYHAVLGDVVAPVHCVPVFGATTPDRWTETWHGIQEVTEEFVKLQYYRFYVVPFHAP